MERALLDCSGFVVQPSFFFFSLLNSKTIPQMSFCLISVLMNISGSTTSPPAVTREPQAMLSRCCLCALSSGCSCQPRQGSEEGNRQGKSVMAFPGPSSPASNRSRWVMKGAGLCPCLPGTPSPCSTLGSPSAGAAAQINLAPVFLAVLQMGKGLLAH